MTLYGEAQQMIGSLYAVLDKLVGTDGFPYSHDEVENMLRRLELAEEGTGKLLVVVDTRLRWEDEDAADAVEVHVFSTAEPQEWEALFVSSDGVKGFEDWGQPSRTKTTGRLERVAVHLPESLSWGPSKL